MCSVLVSIQLLISFVVMALMQILMTAILLGQSVEKAKYAIARVNLPLAGE